MAWVSVTDRLPPTGEWVLVWTGRFHWIAMISDFTRNWVGTYENEYWQSPTHWMPLSAPPQTKTKAEEQADRDDRYFDEEYR